MKRTQVTDPAVVERVTGLLGGRPSFAGIDAARIAKLVRHGAQVDLDPGETLIREAEPGAAELYLLIEGKLLVQSKDVFIARLERPGDLIGETAVLLSSQRTADVVAETPVRVLAIAAAVIALPEFTEIAAGFRAGMLRDDWVQY
jgi:CRP-like cAMP-binding protein